MLNNGAAVTGQGYLVRVQAWLLLQTLPDASDVLPRIDRRSPLPLPRKSLWSCSKRAGVPLRRLVDGLGSAFHYRPARSYLTRLGGLSAGLPGHEGAARFSQVLHRLQILNLLPERSFISSYRCGTVLALAARVMD